MSVDLQEMKFIDSHTHCGEIHANRTEKGSLKFQKDEFKPIRYLTEELKKAKVFECCMFSNVGDIYDRYDEDFVESEYYLKRRKASNDYILDISLEKSQKECGVKIHPYYFVWNDFDVSWKDGSYKGVKWHRHYNEPRYDYMSQKCEEFLQKVYRNKLPIVYEEETDNTLEFAKRLNGRTILIIPHLGQMNGGYETLKEKKLWEMPWVHADMSLAPKIYIKDFVKRFGSERLLFGSDNPFGTPSMAVSRITSCNLKEEELKNICYKNIERLMNLGEKEKI